MRTLEDCRPRGGLSVPLLTALKPDGTLDAASQRRLVHYALSEGYGADILFVGGTTGEALALGEGLRRELLETVLGESPDAEVWAGVTARTRIQTLSLLEHAIQAGAQGAVIAPLTITDAGDLLAFFQREVREVLEASGRPIPVFLYDNADIAADPGLPHLKTALVKRLSRLDFVRGVKVSAPLQVLGNYAKAASRFNERGSFGIYTGNARLVFEIFDTDKGPLRRHLDRFLLHYSLPIGVVAGQANLFPREWQNAWRTAVAGDDREIQRYRAAFEALSAACRPGGRSRTVAALKQALADLGVLGSPVTAPGTPSLAPDEVRSLAAAVPGIRRRLEEGAPSRWITPSPTGIGALR